jgi:hypothetical protein
MRKLPNNTKNKNGKEYKGLSKVSAYVEISHAKVSFWHTYSLNMQKDNDIYTHTLYIYCTHTYNGCVTHAYETHPHESHMHRPYNHCECVQIT